MFAWDSFDLQLAFNHIIASVIKFSPKSMSLQHVWYTDTADSLVTHRWGLGHGFEGKKDDKFWEGQVEQNVHLSLWKY